MSMPTVPSELDRLPSFIRLMRLNRPIGFLLLLWPTLMALWIAGDGHPSWKNLVIFTLGVILMRSAGCVINDYADRDFDGHVARTCHRPLATGEISPEEARKLFLTLVGICFVLVLFTNLLTVLLSFVALAIASLYPFMKRYTHLPQVVLGAAFSCGIPMAFAAEAGQLPNAVWGLFLFNLLWTVAYDTYYAMTDRQDDLKIGIKSTAILFGQADRTMVLVLQLLALVSLVLAGQAFGLQGFFWLSVMAAAACFGWQFRHTRNREPARCFEAFLHNNRVGWLLFLGTALAVTPIGG